MECDFENYKKLLPIGHCGQCSFCKLYIYSEDEKNKVYICLLKEQTLEFFYSESDIKITFPKWCPLEDNYKINTNKKE